MGQLSEREYRNNEVRAWAYLTGVCVVMFVAGLGLGRSVNHSRPMQTREEIKRLSHKQVDLRDQVVLARLNEGDLKQATALELKSLMAEVEKTGKQLRDEERPLKERRGLESSYMEVNDRLTVLKQSIVEETARDAGDRRSAMRARQYDSLGRNIADLQAVPGFLYSTQGYHALATVSAVLKIMMILGIMGTVGFGIAGGINLLYRTRHVET